MNVNNYKWVKTDLILSPACSISLFHSVLDLYFNNDHLLSQLFYFEQNVTLLLVFAVLSYFSISSSIFSKPVSL